MFEESKDVEASLYYLYMMADGEVSNNEKRMFSKICKELAIDNDAKELIIEKCKNLVDKNPDILSLIVKEEIDEKSGQDRFGLRDLSRGGRIVWNLVNLGYADAVYSEEERKIVRHLVDKWKVDAEIYQEFVDAADTMLVLTKKKEWVLSTFSNGGERDKKLKEIDIAMERLLSDINLTIEELTM
ncbi:MAG: TerB family tellurite resistance protein [Lachnospiraceae bacterium]|nr:TerB family tellurite resistance protein [Lachnospiraceae bacterium]